MNNFEKIVSEIQPELNSINQIILDYAVGKSELITTITNHIINSGGKRIRPILHLLCYKLARSLSNKGQINQISIFNTADNTLDNTKNHQLAAAIELIHTATLLHDDVVDNSMIRRGKATSNAIWDNKASILVGDFLFSLSFQLMVSTGNLGALELLSKASSVIADGEVLQLQYSNNLNITKEEYFKIIYGKTAMLFSASCESAGMLCKDLEVNITESLREYGRNLGMVFQIVDDILDYDAEEAVFGKESGHDFFEGKITLPMIFAIQNSNKEEAEILKSAITESQNSSKNNYQNFNQVKYLFKKLGAIEAAKNEARTFWLLAKKNLDNITDNPIKIKLENIADFAFERLI